MKNIFIALLLTLVACQGTHTQKATDASNQTEEAESATVATTDSTDADEAQFPTEVEDDMADIPAGGLNAIRFEGWTDKDWLDNDYIRALRTYIDAYCRGEIKNPELDKYKPIMQSKFVVLNIDPYFAGGVFMSIVFLDNPKCVFTSGVYSDIDENNRVSDYSVHGVQIVDTDCPLTKEQILEIIKEHPENKLW